MTPDQWEQIRDQLHEALQLEPASRSAYLKEIAARDSAVASEVEALLASYQDMHSDFMSAPPSTSSDVAPLAEPLLGRHLGPYVIVELIGAGGMGEVFRAVRTDGQFEKEVAIKLVRTDLNSQTAVSRFKNERQILASLDHPNIAHLLDGDVTVEGIPYLVMELICGDPIDTYCNRQKLTLEQRLQLFLQVCSAVQYAHQRLVIHRDIKPNNILVTLNGAPKLLDFGIAKILDPTVLGGQIENTTTLFRPLTPGYASPEQIRGESVTTASDVYSLGVVLYELLSGCHPYSLHELSSSQITDAVCQIIPEKPSKAAQRDTLSVPGVAAKSLVGDLDNIVLMALRKEPQRRYSSVEKLAEDIRRHLENLPVIASEDTFGYRLAKFVARHRTMVVAATTVAITLFVALLVTISEARIAKRRFDDLHTLAKSLMFEIHDSIQDLPGSTSARKLIVTRALP